MRTCFNPSNTRNFAPAPAPTFGPDEAKKAAQAHEAAQAAAVEAGIQNMAQQMAARVEAGIPAASAAGKHSYSLDVKTTLNQSNWNTITRVAGTAIGILRAKGTRTTVAGAEAFLSAGSPRSSAA